MKLIDSLDKHDALLLEQVLVENDDVVEVKRVVDAELFGIHFKLALRVVQRCKDILVIMFVARGYQSYKVLCNEHSDVTALTPQQVVEACNFLVRQATRTAGDMYKCSFE